MEARVITGPVDADRSGSIRQEGPINKFGTPVEPVQPDISIQNLAAPKYGAASPLPRRFRSRIEKYRLHKRTQRDRFNEFNEKITGWEESIQFRGGRYVATTIEDVLIIEGCSSYGIDIFDEEAEVKAVEVAHTKFIIEEVSKNPEIQRRLGEMVGATDFVKLFQAAAVEAPVEPTPEERAAKLESTLIHAQATIEALRVTMENMKKVEKAVSVTEKIEELQVDSLEP